MALKLMLLLVVLKLFGVPVQLCFWKRWWNLRPGVGFLGAMLAGP